jgi:hypothetical protein
MAVKSLALRAGRTLLPEIVNVLKAIHRIYKIEDPFASYSSNSSKLQITAVCFLTFCRYFQSSCGGKNLKLVESASSSISS